MYASAISAFEGYPFEGKQLFLYPGPAGIAADKAARAKHPVAGYYDGDRVSAAGPAHRPGCTGFPYNGSQLTVAQIRSPRDSRKRVPDGPVKSSAGRVQGQTENNCPALEILVERAEKGGETAIVKGRLDALP